MDPIHTDYGVITVNTATHIMRVIHQDGAVYLQTFTHPVVTRIDRTTAEALAQATALPADEDAYLARLARTDAEMALHDPYKQVFGITSAPREGC